MPLGVWRGCSFLSLDPGINHTGLARYYINQDHSLQIREYLTISPPENDEPLIRAEWIADRAALHVEQHKPAFVFLERPPDTVYHQSRLSQDMLIARAQSVFKTIGVTYTLYTRLRRFTGVNVYLVDPVKWQERSQKARGDLDIKEWSLRLANTLLATASNLEANLHTKRDENIADAISMGYRAYKAGLAVL